MLSDSIIHRLKYYKLKFKVLQKARIFVVPVMFDFEKSF